MSSKSHRSLFLSIVSNEFRSYRDLLAIDLKRPNLDVKVQEDFITTGGTTLEKLDQYIRHCNAVIHLIGSATGAVPQPIEVAALLERYADFVKKLPVLADEFGKFPHRLSYTQWEAYLAIYHLRKLFIYRPTADAPRDDAFRKDAEEEGLQHRHYERILRSGSGSRHVPESGKTQFDGLADLVEILPSLEADCSLESNVPQFDSEFFGRDRDEAMLVDLLGAQQRGLVTITGTGGIGKTRLACETANRLHSRFDGGCFFVELKEVKTLAHIATAVADALGLRLDQIGEAHVVLSRLLKEREPSLLVLDNFEHVSGMADRTVRLWRGAAPQVRILVTSRRALGMPGEVVYPLASLQLPRFEDIDRLRPDIALNTPSVRLFLATAAAQGVCLEKDGNTALLLTNICRKLDGQPLAIILVARRIREFSLDDLLVEVEESRVGAAESDGQALTDTIEWSYRLLNDCLQEAFQRVCVFREGFDRGAAIGMLRGMGDPLGLSPSQLLQRLCECSLVEVIRRGKQTRFQLFQTIPGLRPTKVVDPEAGACGVGEAVARPLRRFRGKVVASSDNVERDRSAGPLGGRTGEYLGGAFLGPRTRSTRSRGSVGSRIRSCPPAARPLANPIRFLPANS